MNAQTKRATVFLWAKRKFESFREGTRHKDIRGRHGELNAMRRLMLTPAVPHSKTYGH